MKSEISRVQVQLFKESQNRRHNLEMRELRSKHYKEYTNEVKKNEELLSRLKEDYQTKIGKLESDLEGNLIRIRAKHKKVLKNENKRLNREFVNLQVNYQKKMNELQSSQGNNLNNVLREHEKVIKNAEERFMKEKRKLDAKTE